MSRPGRAPEGTEKRKEEVRRVGSKTSPSPSAAPLAEQGCQANSGGRLDGEARLAVVCHWVELKFITRERPLKKRKILLKILLKPN